MQSIKFWMTMLTAVSLTASIIVAGLGMKYWTVQAPASWVMVGVGVAGTVINITFLVNIEGRDHD